MAKEKKAHKGHQKKEKKNDSLKNLSGNYWAISTFVLAALLVVAIIFGFRGSGQAIVNPQVAGQKVIDFAASQGAEAELVSVEDSGSLYQITVSIQGQEVPVYITKDGKTLVPQPVPLDGSTTNTQQNTQTQASQPSATVSTKSDKPVIELFVMSHCPYGTQVEKGILPVVGLLGDKIDFEVKFVYYAMHESQGEVEEELNQYCIENEQNDKYLPYLKCFLEAGDGQGCMDQVGVDKAALQTCTTATDAEYNVEANVADKSSWLSGRFPKVDLYKEDNEKYKVAGSPTLVINGETVQSARDSNSLLKVICSAFNTAPEECNTDLGSDTPGPGFGWSTTGAANAAAYCG